MTRVRQELKAALDAVMRRPRATLVAAALVLAIGFRWAARLARPGLLWVVVLIGGPLLLWRHCQFRDTYFNAYAFVPGLRTDLHAPSAGAQFLDAQRKEPGRVVGWGNTLFPSYNTALRWEGLYGVDAVRSREYQEFAVEFGQPSVQQRRSHEWAVGVGAPFRPQLADESGRAFEPAASSWLLVAARSERADADGL